jgi:hypothetical protein
VLFSIQQYILPLGEQEEEEENSSLTSVEQPLISLSNLPGAIIQHYHGGDVRQIPTT